MPAPQDPPPSSSARYLRYLPLLVFVAAAALAPVLWAHFIRLDDYSHLMDNTRIRRMSLDGLAELWTKPFFNLYIPITYTVWWAAALLANLSGPISQSPGIFHALNLAVHLANVVLVFFIARLLLPRARRQATPTPADAGIAFVAALLFALHPVQVETVAWVSELKGGLGMLFGLAGLFLHYRFARPAHRALVAACFVAAMLSKPSAIVFPGVVFLVDRLLLGKSLRKSAALPALYGALLLPLVFFTKHLQPDANLDFIPSIAQRFVVAADALAIYAYKVLFPFPLAIDYGRSPPFVLHHVPLVQIALSALLPVAALGWVVKGVVRPKAAAPTTEWLAFVRCGLAIFFLGLAPVLGFLPFGFQEFSTVADHYLYTPLFGIALAALGLGQRFQSARHARIVAAVLLGALGVLSFRQALLWRDTETLFAHTLDVNPRSHLAQYSIASEYLLTGRTDQAFDALKKTLDMNPNYLNAQIGYGLALSQRGMLDEAIAHYERSLAKRPNARGNRAHSVSSLHNNLGLLLVRAGRVPDAIEHFRQAVTIFPRSVNGHLNLANLAMDQGRYADAVAEYQTVLSINPGNPLALDRLPRARAAANGLHAVPAP